MDSRKMIELIQSNLMLDTIIKDSGCISLRRHVYQNVLSGKARNLVSSMSNLFKLRSSVVQFFVSF